MLQVYGSKQPQQRQSTTNSPDSLIKSFHFVSCWVRRSFIHFAKCLFWQTLNCSGLIVNSAYVQPRFNGCYSPICARSSCIHGWVNALSYFFTPVGEPRLRMLLLMLLSHWCACSRLPVAIKMWREESREIVTKPRFYCETELGTHWWSYSASWNLVR